MAHDGLRMSYRIWFSRGLRGKFGFETGYYPVEEGLICWKADADDTHTHFDGGPDLGWDVFPCCRYEDGGNTNLTGRDSQLESIRLRCWMIVAR